ncbi:MAG TPA: dynamin family protein [Anaerolineaceae bacterium]|nr:dynamin family protein [Anaerolineaceae bacterium]
MRPTMLTDEQAQFLHDEKAALTDALLRLNEINSSADSLSQLQQAILQLDELFLLVFVGEFNSGKSALINALLGEKVLIEGVTPTTSRVTLVRWGEQRSERVVEQGYAVITHPLPLLQELNIVDSPGTNAIIREHERLTDEFVPRSDLVLFITSADRPLTESERQFLQRILAWGKKIVFVLNKTDILQDESAITEVTQYILANASILLGETPQLFPVSARLAQQAALALDPLEKQRLRLASGLDALETFILSTLEDTSRLQLKFLNPLGVADNLASQASASINSQSDDLEYDRQTVASLDTAVSAYEHDLKLELPPRLAEVENILQKIELRGMDFFDRTLRLTNIHHLIKSERVRADFEKEVSSDLTHEIDDQVQRLIDWLVDKDLREWQQVMGYLQRRQALNVEHIVSSGISPQASRRRELIDKVGESVRKIVASYNKTREASQLAANVQSAVAGTALFEAGAVGLGVLVSTALLSSAMDVTGIITASTLAVVGLFVIPYKRKQAKDNFRRKITTMRTTLSDTLSATFKHESETAISRMKDNIAPYTRYVHSEEERITKTKTMLTELRERLSTLRARIPNILAKS